MKIVIVGGGIIGLTTGLYLKKTFKDLVWALLLEFHGAVNFQTPK